MQAALEIRGCGAASRKSERGWMLLLLAIFVLYGMANSLNHLLVHQFMKVFGISRLRASWLQPMYYMGYVTAALPAGIFVERWGTRRVLRLALCAFSAASALVAVATWTTTYLAVLLPVFLLAVSVSALESTAGPCVLASAEGERGARRLCLAQALNSVGMVLGATFGTFVVFTNTNVDTSTAANRACLPFLFFVVVAMVLFAVVRPRELPAVAARSAGRSLHGALGPLHSRRFVLVFVTALIYMATQTCTWSFLLQYLRAYGVGSDRAAGMYYMGTLALFAVGRIAQSFVLRRPSSTGLLLAAAVAGTVCMGYAVEHPGPGGGVALVLCGLPLSVIYPLLYVKGVQPLGAQAQAGGSLMVCSLLGGAIAPPLMAHIAHKSNSYAVSYALPLCGFVWLAGVGVWLLLRAEQPEVEAAAAV